MIAEGRRMAVYQQPPSFGMRHAEGFNRVLDGGGAGAGVIERNASALASNKVRKLAVEPEPRSRHEASSDDA